MTGASSHQSGQSLWMIVASFLFGCMGVCVKFAAEHNDSGEIVFWRCIVALVIVSGFMLLRRRPPRTAHLRSHAFRSLSGFSALFLYFYAITQLPLATAVTLNYTSPIFFVMWQFVLRGVRPTRLAWGTLLFGFMGVVLLLRPTMDSDNLFGAILGLISGGLAGLAYFHIRELGSLGEPEWRTVFYFSLFSAVGASLWVIWRGFRWPLTEDLGWLIGAGVFATGAQLSLTRAYKSGKTLLSNALAYTTVIFASLFGGLFFGERIDSAGLLAIGLIITSGVMASRIRFTKAKAP
jgi:S-adenosylmethionine uptake transporter